MAVVHNPVHHMTPLDKQFYRELGQRIAEFRKAKGFTQVQLAEALGIAQQTMAHYESGNLRVAVALLPPIAKLLGVSYSELMGEEEATKKKRGPVSTLHQQVEQITLMPRAKQKFISEMLDALIKQQRSA